MAIIKSPIFYMGNKYDLLSKLLLYFPKKQDVSVFVDLFGGSGVVSANVPYKKILYNELNENIVGILNVLKKLEPDEIIKHINDKIKEFDLAKARQKSYIEFRNHYNKSDKHPLNLMTLTFYSFSNLMRFNNKNEFNMPVGKNYFKKGEHDIQIKLFSKILKEKDIEIINYNAFEVLEKITENNNQFIYLDPPYLNTTAIYNEARAFGGWCLDDDLKLFKELDRIHNIGIKWALSNVLENKGIKNEHLEKWAKSKNYKITYIEEKEYASLGKGNAHSKEVLITNYEPSFERYNIFDFME